MSSNANGLDLLWLASAIATALAFAPINAWWLLFIAPAGWLGVLSQVQGARRVAIAFGWGLVFIAVQSLWALPTFAQQAQADWAAGVAWLIVLIWYACWCALFGWLVGRLPATGWIWAVGAASGWVVVCWLRSLGAWGFPWAMLALPLARFPLLLQPAELGGIWLVEWLLMLWNALLVQVWREAEVRAWAVPLSGLALWVGGSVWLWQQARATPLGEPVRVAVLQTEYDALRTLFSAQIYDSGIERLLEQARQSGADWAILPESSETYFWASLIDRERLRQWQEWAQRYSMHILTGVTRQHGEHGFNSALGISPRGTWAFYNKMKLMPFTEYAPAEPIAEWLKVLGVSRRSLRCGERVHALRLGKEPPVGALICYESLYGWIAAQAVRDGAQWLVAITNDRWLLGAGVREQYADYSLVRAIETRRWVARASTVGISGFFSPLGERWEAPGGRPYVMTHTLYGSSQQTLYARWGDYWGYLCGLLYGAGVVWRVILSARARHIPAADVG